MNTEATAKKQLLSNNLGITSWMLIILIASALPAASIISSYSAQSSHIAIATLATGWIFFYKTVHFIISAGTIFESFRRFSLYGLSQNHPRINVTLSVSVIILAFLGAISVYFTLSSIAFMIFGKLRSPDIKDDNKKNILERRYFPEVLNFGLFLMLTLILQFFGPTYDSISTVMETLAMSALSLFV